MDLSSAEKADAELAALYEQVPDVGCRGLCVDACGPIGMGLREWVRMARAGVRLPPIADQVRQMAASPQEYRCPALHRGRCSVYAVRPMVCRLFGAVVDLPCPYGCRPSRGERLLDSATARALLNAANEVGGPEPASNGRLRPDSNRHLPR